MNEKKVWLSLSLKLYTAHKMASKRYHASVFLGLALVLYVTSILLSMFTALSISQLSVVSIFEKKALVDDTKNTNSQSRK